jgi:hypothetical protein
MRQSVFAFATFREKLRGKWRFQKRFAYWLAERSAQRRGKPMIYREDARVACRHWIINPQ